MRRITACLILFILCLNFPTWTPALTDENGGALPEYSWADGIRLALGDAFSRNAILPQTKDVKLADTVPKLDVPAYFCMGRHDYMTPSEVAYS